MVHARLNVFPILSISCIYKSTIEIENTLCLAWMCLPAHKGALQIILMGKLRKITKYPIQSIHHANKNVSENKVKSRIFIQVLNKIK